MAWYQISSLDVRSNPRAHSIFAARQSRQKLHDSSTVTWCETGTLVEVHSLAVLRSVVKVYVSPPSGREIFSRADRYPRTPGNKISSLRCSKKLFRVLHGYGLL